MRRISLYTVLVLSLILSMGISASAAQTDDEKCDNVWIAPETETTINGQPESSVVTPRDVIVGPYFSSYKYGVKTKVDKFRLIGQFTHSNRLGTSTDLMTATVTNSTAQGSEWSAGGQLTAGIEVAIIGEIKLQGGGSYKSSRVANEAVGYSVTHNVPAGKVGHIDLYYRGFKISGQVTTWSAWTGDMEGSKCYSTYDVYAILFPSNNLDIYSEAYDSTK